MSSLQHFDSSFARIDSAGGDIFSHNIGNVEVIGSGNTVSIQTLAPETRRAPAPRCPPASDKFVGRIQELERMRQFFFGPGVTFDQRKIFLLVGMGGCGKTQLSRKFMSHVYRKFKATRHLVFYVDATTAETLETSFVAIAKARGIGESTDMALRWMSNLDEEFFLYFDNADDHNINLREYFPRSDYARVLITTRLRDAQQHYGSARDSVIHLGPLSESEAVELLALVTMVDPDGSQQAAKTLVHELQCLPLAIAQAGAAIFKSKWTIEEYLEQFRRLRTRLMDGEQDRVEAKALDDYPWHVHSTWRLSYNQLSGPTATLLRLCAHLHHTGITEEIFRLASQGLNQKILRTPPVPFTQEEPTARSFMESFTTDGAWDKNKFRWCIQEACSFSLMSYDTNSHVYSIHPLVHDCLQSIAPHHSQGAFLLAATIEPLWNDQERLTALLSHVQRIVSNVEHRKGTSLHPVLLHCLGACFLGAGMYSTAIKLQRAAVQELSILLGPDHAIVLDIQNVLALVLSRSGRHGDAEQVQREVLEHRQNSLGDNHPATIKASANLASTLQSMDRYDEAEVMKREVLQRRQATIGSNHPDTIRALANLAASLWSLDHCDEAERIDREVLEQRQATLGASHPDTILALANLAWRLQDVGMVRQVFERRRSSLGEDHPGTIHAMANLVTLLRSLGRYDEAEGMQREVLERYRATFGIYDPHTIRALSALETIVQSLGRFEEAGDIRRTINDRRQWGRKISGADRVLPRLAVTYNLHLRNDEVEPLHRGGEALEGYTLQRKE